MRAWFGSSGEPFSTGMKRILGEMREGCREASDTIDYLFFTYLGEKEIQAYTRATMYKWGLNPEFMHCSISASVDRPPFDRDIEVSAWFSIDFSDDEFSVAIRKAAQFLSEQCNPILNHLRGKDSRGIIEPRFSYEPEGEISSSSLSAGGSYTSEFIFSIDSDDDPKILIPVKFKVILVMEGVVPPGAQADDGTRAPTNKFYVRLSKEERSK